MNPEIKRETLKCLETSQNGDSTHQNGWDTSKSVLRWKFKKIKIGKFPAISSNIKKWREKTTKPWCISKIKKKKTKRSPRLLKGLIRTRTEINEMETINAKYKGKRADCLKGKKIDKNPGSSQKKRKKNQFKNSKMKRGCYNQHHSNTTHQRWRLWVTTCRQVW